MRASRLRHLCVAASVFALFLSNVRAADIDVSNLTATATYTPMNNATLKLANSFTTSAFTGTSSIDSVTLKLGGGGYDLSTLSVGIYTNNVGLPSGTRVGADYTASGLVFTGGDYTFSNIGANRAELNPSSTYWLVVHNTTATWPFWAFISTPGPFNGTNASISVGSLSNPLGTGWNTNTTDQTFLFSLVGVGVPEPSTYAMGTVGVMTLAGLARRRKKTTASA